VKSVYRYIAFRWLHAYELVPVAIYAEINDRGFENRRIDEFRDGRLERTDRYEPDLRTSLSQIEVPFPEELADDPVREVLPITREGFEALWERATDAYTKLFPDDIP
jgi:hypothetical protein